MLPACFRLWVCNPRSLSLPALFPKNVRQQDAAPAGSHCSFTPYRFLLLSRVADPATDGCGLQTRSNVGVFTWVCLRVGVFTWVCLRGCVCVWVFTWLQTRSNVALPLAHVLPHVLSHVLPHVLPHVPSHVPSHVLIHVQAGMLPACFRLRVCNPRSLSLPALFPKNVRQQDAAPAGSHCSFTPYRFLLLSRVADPATDGCGLQTRSNVGVFTCGCVCVWVFTCGCLRGCVYVGVFACGCVYVWVFTWLQTRSNVALPLAHVLIHVPSHVLSHVPSHVLIHVLIHVQAGMLPACFRLRVCNPRSLLLPALFPKNVRQQDAAPAGSHCSFTPYRFLLLSRVADPATDGCGLQTRSNVGVFAWVCLRVGVYVGVFTWVCLRVGVFTSGCLRVGVCVWVFACGCLRGCVFVERGHCLF